MNTEPSNVPGAVAVACSAWLDAIPWQIVKVGAIGWLIGAIIVVPLNLILTRKPTEKPSERNTGQTDNGNPILTLNLSSNQSVLPLLVGANELRRRWGDFGLEFSKLIVTQLRDDSRVHPLKSLSAPMNLIVTIRLSLVNTQLSLKGILLIHGDDVVTSSNARTHTRRTDDVNRESGTESAIRRCVQ